MAATDGTSCDGVAAIRITIASLLFTVAVCPNSPAMHYICGIRVGTKLIPVMVEIIGALVCDATRICTSAAAMDRVECRPTATTVRTAVRRPPC